MERATSNPPPLETLEALEALEATSLSRRVAPAHPTDVEIDLSDGTGGSENLGFGRCRRRARQACRGTHLPLHCLTVGYPRYPRVPKYTTLGFTYYTTTFLRT